LSKALRLAGFELLPGRYLAPLAPAWQQLAQRLDSKQLELGLSRLMRFCSANDIAPEAVDDAVLRRFHTALEQESLLRNPRGVHQSATRAWNKAVARIPGWPAIILEVPSYRRPPYVLPVTRFPGSFQADLTGWLDRLAGTDLLSELPFRPVRASTVERRRFQILQLASALVHRGRDPDSLGSLADLVAPENLREALRFFLERADEGRSTRQIHNLAMTALTMARHWVKVDDAQEQVLRGIMRRCDPGLKGMTEKNRAVLRRIEDPQLVQALLGLPARVVALLDLYLARARPLLQSRSGPWLFPGKKGSAKSRHTLGMQIGDTTEQVLGMRLSPHQFRHACGAIYLSVNPGGHEVVRHLLGHSSIATTIRFYAGMETAAALRHYDSVILSLCQETPPAGSRRG
jgi:integrase